MLVMTLSSLVSDDTVEMTLAMTRCLPEDSRLIQLTYNLMQKKRDSMRLVEYLYECMINKPGIACIHKQI
jgi:hypothetical protein